MPVISFTNNKGGVGKFTLTMNLAGCPSHKLRTCLKSTTYVKS